MRQQYLLLFIATLLFFSSCKKESITPVDPLQDPAVFSLVSSGTSCSNATVAGTYTAGTALNNTHTITIQVNVTKPGTYAVSTSFINGMRFADTGRFVSTGIGQMTLKSFGTPINAGPVVVNFFAGSSLCSFTITVSGFTPPPPPVLSNDNDHMLFGNPGDAAMVIDSFRNYLMRKPYYAVSYNRDRGIPNWVSWHLYTPDLGTTPRQDDFRPDNSLPAGWYQVQANSFSGSGFDRGHNAPSADRTSSYEANSSTFLMTNMIPQAPFQNQEPWARLEDSLRRLVNAGFELYIIMGNYGTGGTGNNGFANTVDGGRVTVPAAIWKIALIIPNGNNDSSRVDASSRLIAVTIPNSNNVNTNWKNYRVSVDAIEAATGYNLLDRLSPSLQGVLEGRIDAL